MTLKSRSTLGSRFIALAQGTFLATAFLMMSSGCTNTVTGMGKDIQNMGQAMNSKGSPPSSANKANPSDSLSQGKDVVVTPVVVAPSK